MRPIRLLALGISAAALSFIADQLLKSWAHWWVGAHGIIRPIPGLTIIVTSNTGVAFSIAQGAAPWILISIGLALSALLLVWLTRARRPVHSIGLAWPDIIVAAGIAGIFLHSAWVIVHDARLELRSRP